MSRSLEGHMVSHSPRMSQAYRSRAEQSDHANNQTTNSAPLNQPMRMSRECPMTNTKKRLALRPTMVTTLIIVTTLISRHTLFHQIMTSKRTFPPRRRSHRLLQCQQSTNASVPTQACRCCSRQLITLQVPRGRRLDSRTTESAEQQTAALERDEWSR